MKTLALWLLTLYRWGISPLLPPHCRFHPTCSCYAQEAIQHYGFARGSLLTLRRLAKCHPWHPGGYDPVPGTGTGNDRSDTEITCNRQ
ncbi:MAG: membrane protein insertion efficiency factor YidD [Pseudomonadota bacterium]|nr:membrane protein insertion efficiency factor YidD [Pseudomonadota bacterium]